MAANTKIEWADHTFNPWVGCTPVSAACDNCYAESWAKRTGHPELWQGQRRKTANDNWKLPYKWNAIARQTGKRARVFCASLADVFDNQVPEEWRAELFRLIFYTEHLDWLLLTKRPQNAQRMMEKAAAVAKTGRDLPWKNIWIGTTVENQTEANRRIPFLLGTPAAVHFLSCEPLLGPVDLRNIEIGNGVFVDALTGFHSTTAQLERGLSEITDGSLQKLMPTLPAAKPAIGWVIVGGESGPGARPMEPQWARDLREQCAAVGAAFFFKQWGQWLVAERDPTDQTSYKFQDGTSFHVVSDGHDIVLSAAQDADKPAKIWREYWGDGRGNLAKRLPKTATGRRLDGVEYNQLPMAA